jgi:RNA polymerase sigma-70 factor (ECF subfamily)
LRRRSCWNNASKIREKFSANILEAFGLLTRITHVRRTLTLRTIMYNPLPTSDEELLRLLAVGDESAFTTLYRQHQPPIYRFALLMSGSAAVAEDVTQEVFLALMRDAHRFDSARGTLSAYLYGIARKQVLRHHARHHSHISLSADDDEDVPLLIADDDPLRDCARREVIVRVRQAVLALPAKYREVVVLCDFQELSYAEAAAALDCAIGTVCSRLHRGHALLLERLRTLKPANAPLRDVAMRFLT